MLIENWSRFQALFPHAKSASEQVLKDENSLREWALIMHNAAWYALERGGYDDVDKMLMRAINVRRRVLGQEHPDTLTSMDNLALMYINQG